MFNETVNQFGARNAELCVRMKRNYTRDDMNRFLNEMGDRLAADNLFVYGISNIREFRDIHLDGKGREMSNKFSLMAFMLSVWMCLTASMRKPRTPAFHSEAR